MDSIRVAADLRWPEGTGIGICQQEHLSRMPGSFELNRLDIKGGVGSPLSPLRVARALRRDRASVDVFWSPGFVPPAWSSVPGVVTVHDLTHLHFYSPLHVRYYDLVFKPLYQRCSAIICVSEYTRNELLNWSGVHSSRVHVVHNGLSPIFRTDVEPHCPGYPYIFYPGNKRRYKNLDMMLRAYARSSLLKLGFKVVMTGTATPDLHATIVKLGIADNVVFLGFVPDHRLPSLYRGATFTAFISLYEGFGLPIVESMAVGTPVITSNVSSMPEIAAGAASVVPPRDLDEIVGAMDTIVSDRAFRSDLVAKGIRRAADFSWDRAATQTWNIIRSAAGAH